MNTQTTSMDNSGGVSTKPVMVVERTFIDSLPQDLREENSLSKFKDVAGLAKSYLNLEQKLGGERLAIPGETDAEGWNALYRKLGRPETPEGYDLGLHEELLPGLLTEEHLGWFRSLAHKWGLNPRQARGMFQEYLSMARKGMEEEERGLQQMLAEEQERVKRSLQQAYGPSAGEKTALLQKVVKRFGGEDLEGYLQEIGGMDPRLVMALIRVGESMGEDTLAGGLSHQQITAAEQAASEIKRLRGDKVFREAYFNKSDPGHEEAVERMTRLFEQAHQEGGRN